MNVYSRKYSIYSYSFLRHRVLHFKGKMGKAQKRRRREQRKRARETSFTDKKEGETHLNSATNTSTPGKPPFKKVPKFNNELHIESRP